MWIMPLGVSDSCETAAHYQKDKINSKQQNNWSNPSNDRDLKLLMPTHFDVLYIRE